MVHVIYIVLLVATAYGACVLTWRYKLADVEALKAKCDPLFDEIERVKEDLYRARQMLTEEQGRFANLNKQHDALKQQRNTVQRELDKATVALHRIQGNLDTWNEPTADST